MSSVPLHVAVVSSSNHNRSMEAHWVLSKQGFNVKSFGTKGFVRLPGPTPDKPNIYDFQTMYEKIYRDLLKKDRAFYTQNGILHMLDRNRRIKSGPEQFQSSNDLFNVIFTCEEQVYDQVVEHLNAREQMVCQLVHVINVNIPDSYEEATHGAFLISELCHSIQEMEDVDDEIAELLQKFEVKTGKTFLHTVCFY
ncbi:RNA polymerase II subunit A C-terminal domain phosphatase SSU72-like [Mesocricetus auratus]|uniref:RNA polymerase II subunit A C-terminal domain phosphatase SSU72 n=1 Tax=Mesocricetus auratus TaxID=10036 RepID=A0ABM2WFQ2_MESAU|nr:RNA polymerase II subunit A C-terminal domain phosphatase SSU72-like [Mesocricetus auratus]